MSKEKKSVYNFAYKVGISVFIILVAIVSFIVITLFTKSFNTSTKVNIQSHDSLITMMDTVYLPNPNAVKVVIHDTFYKTTTCTKRHCDVLKTTKDTSKSK